MSDTPETDAHQLREHMAYDRLWSEFARRLERQRDALQKKLDEKEKAHQVTRDTARRLSAEKHQAASQRDAYAETLRLAAQGMFGGFSEHVIRERHPELAENADALRREGE